MSTSSRVPSVEKLIDELVADPTLRSTLKEFNSTYEGIRHFGEPKHANVIGIDGPHFTSWMLALQRLGLELGRPGETIEQNWFQNTFEVEWIGEEDS